MRPSEIVDDIDLVCPTVFVLQVPQTSDQVAVDLGLDGNPPGNGNRRVCIGPHEIVDDIDLVCPTGFVLQVPQTSDQVAVDLGLDGNPPGNGNRRVCVGHSPVAEDDTPPVITEISADPDILGPPNHKARSVEVSVVATDDSGEAPSCAITSVTNNETGVDDAVITGDLSVDLMAERSGKSNDRVYTINVECTDAVGNSAAGSTTVTVAHDQGNGKAKGRNK